MSGKKDWRQNNPELDDNGIWSLAPVAGVLFERVTANFAF